MTYKFKDQCGAWAMESKVYLRFKYVNNCEVKNIRSLVTWESKDGSNFHFFLKDINVGKLIQEIKGAAVIDGNILGGIANYTEPSS
jgi:hypothetical protein